MHSQILERMGITRWRLKASAQVCAPEEIDEFAEELLPEQTDTIVQEPTLIAAQEAKPESFEHRVSAIKDIEPVKPQENMSLEKVSSQASEVGPLKLKGKLITGASTGSFFVIACEEGRNKDALIDVHQESGRLLAAMLKTVNQSPSVMMLGRDNFDSVTVEQTVLLLGERAAKTVLGPEVKPPFRGRVHQVRGVRAVCTYHPEELRLNATLKPMAWDDLRLLSSLLVRS